MSLGAAASEPVDVSKWIPRRRIAITRTIAVGLFVAALTGAFWWTPALLLGVPALAVAWVAWVMARVRTQLSLSGAGWERRIHEVVAESLGLGSDASMSVLDVGCGDAGLIDILLGRSPSLAMTGVDLWSDGWDYSQEACERRLDQHGRHARFRRMDAGRLDFADGSFQAVVSVMCFHEVPTVTGDTVGGPVRAVAEALRVLQPGGRFVLVDRFDDHRAFEPAALDSVLRHVSLDTRQSLVSRLGIPWPLNGRPSLGPVRLIAGTKPHRW